MRAASARAPAARIVGAALDDELARADERFAWIAMVLVLPAYRRRGYASRLLRVALAETLFRLGHLRECAKQAQEILTTLPYCVKANLLLGYAWVESGVREGEVYMKRAREIDPEGIFARYLFGDRTLIKFEKPQLPSIEEAEDQADKEAAEIFAQEPAALGESLSAFEKSLTREETPPVPDKVASSEPEPVVVSRRVETVAQVEQPEPVVVPERVETMAQVEHHEPVVISKRVETPAQVEQHIHVPLPSKRPLIARALDQLPQWLRKTISRAEAPEPAAPVAAHLAEPVAAAAESIPDPGLNAAIRAAVNKASGPLTQEDLVSLTNLDASRHEVESIAGLERIYINGGKRGYLVSMAPGDLIRVLKPVPVTVGIA